MVAKETTWTNCIPKRSLYSVITKINPRHALLINIITMNNRPRSITPDLAISFLPDSDVIHVMRKSGEYSHLLKSEIIEMLNKYPDDIEISAMDGRIIGYGLVVFDQKNFLFIKTNIKEVNAFCKLMSFLDG